MNFQSVLRIASVCIIIAMTNAENTVDNMGVKLKMFDGKRYSINLSLMEPRHALLRKKRSTSLVNAQSPNYKNLVANEIDLKGINTVLPTNIDDVDKKRIITKRHACRNHHNRWNHFRLGYDNNNNYEIVKNKESSEESDEVNTEDPSYVASAENLTKKQEEKITIEPQNSSYNKRRKNNSKNENRNTNNESKNVKRNEDNESENEKRKDSGESADKEEFIFTNVPSGISANKENKNRRNIRNRDNHRVERDVIEEENVAATAPSFKFTSGYGDFGSKIYFRNINV